MMDLRVSDMDVINISLKSIELLGKGVRAYRIIQNPLPEGASLPELKPTELTEKAQILGGRLRGQALEARESFSAVPLDGKLSF